MSRQDKATTERNAKVLRELVKKPENKVCADCKRNDPRWASWNLGVFICIRCSGLHRSMGTHISKVKSVDLDMWTPEQMQSIQKWGNSRANLYWEAHLKPGHIPPDHKMESFIRSKYESRRWALEGARPEDPSVLERERMPSQNEVSIAATMPSASIQPAPTVAVSATSALPSAPKPPSHVLMSSGLTSRIKSSFTTPVEAHGPRQPSNADVQPAATSQPTHDLFALDFHSPAPSTNSTSAKKDVKSDILSLFASSNAPPLRTTHQTSPVSLANPQGAAMWGAQPALSTNTSLFFPQTSAPPPQSHQALAPTFGADVWSGQADPFASFGAPATATLPAPKDDAFSDLWGDFK